MTISPSQFVMVTRPGNPGKILTKQIIENGGKAIHFPTLAFQALTNTPDFYAALETVNQQDWLIFISPEAAKTSLPAIQARWPILTPNIQFASVGAKTAQLIQEKTQQTVIFPEKNWDTENLLALPPFLAVSQQKILLIKGEGGRDTLQNELRKRGAIVSQLISYKRVLPHFSSQEMKEYIHLIKQGKITTIIISSIEGLINLKSLLGEVIWPLLAAIPLMVMSQRIKTLAEHLGFQTIWVAENGDYIKILATLV